MTKKSPNPSRRQFLSVAGATVVSLSASPMKATTEMASTSDAAGRIDCQSHLFVPDLLDFMEKRKTQPYTYRKGNERYVVVGRMASPHSSETH